MNTTFTNSTLYELELFALYVSSPVIIFLQIINISIGLPLNIYVIIVILTKAGRIDGSAVFTLSQTVSEIVFDTTAPLFILCQVNVTNLCFLKPIRFFIGVCLTSRFLLQCCVGIDRYLAVVHPVTFLRYKQVKYRLLIIIIVSVYSFMYGTITMVFFAHLPYYVFGILYAIILQVFFSLCFSILRVLRKPGPGQRDRRDNGASIAKRKAFEVVSFNLLTFLTQSIPISVAFAAQKMLSIDAFQSAFIISMGINISVGFLQPLFFLHQVGKMTVISCA